MFKILLVEDSKFRRLATEDCLVRAGDGDQALRLAREQLPDRILFDMLLPKTSRPDVLKARKKG
jgi:CheY-like chemotaxis protein